MSYRPSIYVVFKCVVSYTYADFNVFIFHCLQRFWICGLRGGDIGSFEYLHRYQIS